MSLSKHLVGPGRATTTAAAATVASASIVTNLASPASPAFSSPPSNYRPSPSAFCSSTSNSIVYKQASAPLRTLHSQTRQSPLKLSELRNRANMSTMPAQHGHSEACCNVPPVVADGYTTKGTYEELGGFKTCTFCLCSQF
jgi:hypothetical protein